MGTRKGDAVIKVWVPVYKFLALAYRFLYRYIGSYSTGYRTVDTSFFLLHSSFKRWVAQTGWGP